MSSLELLNFDLYRRINIQDHRTSDYLSRHLVLRRGQPFYISCTFNRAVQPAKDSINVLTEIGAHLLKNPVTVDMPIFRRSSGSAKDWQATCASLLGTTVTISIFIPINAIIGKYKMTLQTVNFGSINKQVLGKFYVLFNPWAEDDDVYMSDEDERREYVLNEIGIVYSGTAQTRIYRPWDYGQFEERILDIIISLLEKSLKAKTDAESELYRRSHASHVCRALCRMINSQGGKVLIGNWSKDCSSGMRPTTWNGSIPVLQHWYRKGSVSFGQCWVFAGVLCTALRSLGIPARVTTIFDSARNFDRQFNVDCLFRADGKLFSSRSTGVWTFQSWNEIWLRRDAMCHDAIYNGWHALISDTKDFYQGLGFSRFGPVPLRAIKEGDVNAPHCALVFAKLNSRLVESIKSRELPEKKVYTNDQTVGRFIGTKALGALTEVDVTEDYKYPEGSAKAREIRATFQNAAARLESLMYQVRGPNTREAAIRPDFEGSFEQHGQTHIGEDLNATLTLKNTASEKKEVEVNLSVASILYIQVPVKEIHSQQDVISLEPNEEKHISLSIKYDEYKNDITPTPDNLIQMMAVCKDEKGIYLLCHKVMALLNPPLLIKVSEDPVFNKPFSVDIIFSNPLTEDLENCHLFVEGSGLLRESIALMFPSMEPKQSAAATIILHPYRPGKRYLLVNFSSDKISDVKAYKEIIIPPLVVEYKQ